MTNKVYAITVGVLVLLLTFLSVGILLKEESGVRELQVMTERTECYMFQAIRKGGETQVTEVILDVPCIKEQWPFAEVTIRE
jgi:hypothetical protein